MPEQKKWAVVLADAKNLTLDDALYLCNHLYEAEEEAREHQTFCNQECRIIQTACLEADRKGKH